MGLFRKKRDPVSERAKTLNEQIAALEAEIQKLTTVSPESPAPAQASKGNDAEPATAPPHPPPPVPAGSGTVQPRLRSTAFPAKNQPPPSPPAPSSSKGNPFVEPVFEDVGQKPVNEEVEQAAAPNQTDLGVRRYDMASLWRRLINHFRGPATSNPKLVNYLAAGSIQGLRPLRYEKRVARNRFIFFVAVLIAVLWGLIAVWMKRS